MKIKRKELAQDRDEFGELEEFTWDLFPVVEAPYTRHLDANGLPKVGTRIVPCMILIGRIAKTKLFDANNQPTALEIHGLPFENLASKYGRMWKGTSLYATEDMSGVVERAFLEKVGDKLRAVAELRESDDIQPT